MPRARFYHLAPRARARLLRIATKHLARRGLEGASLNEILAEAGLSKGAYYYYFDDKDDLLATILDDAVEEMLGRVRLPPFERLAREEFWPTVGRLIEAWTTAMDFSSDLFRVAVQFTAAQRQSARFAPILARAQALYRAVIEPGRRLGCVRTDLPVEVLVRLVEANDAALDGIFLSLHATVTRASLAHHARLVFDTFRRLLEVRPPAPGRSRARTPRRRAPVATGRRGR